MKRTDITAIFPNATEDEVSRVLNLNGADVNAARASTTDLQTKLNEATEEIRRLKDGPTAEKLQAEIDRANGLQKELDGIKKAETLRTVREKVAKEKKIPADLLTGDTEEACTAQAEAILAFANPEGYPNVQDGGALGGTPKASTADQFANWFNSNL